MSKHYKNNKKKGSYQPKSRKILLKRASAIASAAKKNIDHAVMPDFEPLFEDFEPDVRKMVDQSIMTDPQKVGFSPIAIRTATRKLPDTPEVLKTLDSFLRGEGIQMTTTSIDRDNNMTFEDEETARSINPEGSRVFPISHILSFIQELCKHGQVCKMQDIIILNEQLYGIHSRLEFECISCFRSFLLTSGGFYPKIGYQINVQAVFASMISGGGLSNISEFLSVLGIPVLRRPAYTRLESILGKKLDEELRKSINTAIKEIETEREGDEYDFDGKKIISLIGDCGWSKRSYSHNYNAMSGAGVLIEQNSKKLIYLGVKNKYCSICCMEGDIKSHECFKNYTGSSTGMEAQIILEGFREIERTSQLRPLRYIADGDSNTYYTLVNQIPLWGCRIEKIECINHILKNLRKNLEVVRNNCGKNGKCLTDMFISHFVAKCRSIINKIPELRDDGIDIANILAKIPDHINGDHRFCNSAICDYEKVKGEELLHKDVISACQDIFHRLSLKSDRLHANFTTNLAENYNSIRVKMDSGKIKNYIQRGAFEFRAICAALRYNEGVTWVLKFWEANFDKPNPFFVTEYENRDNKQKENYEKRRTPEFRQKAVEKKFTKTSKKGNDEYGSNAKDVLILNAEAIDKLVSDMANYYHETKKNHTKNTIIEISQKTTSQSESPEWYSLRRNLITGTKTPKIAKLREKPCNSNRRRLVYEYLYGTQIRQTQAMKHGIINEPKARKWYEEIYSNVKESGLVLHPLIPWLGCSPDGIVDDTDESRGIIEIKCPYNARDLTIDEYMTNKDVCKDSCLEKKDDGIRLKRGHDYYYQIHHNMYVCEVNWCDFIIYTNKDTYVERVLFDKVFWEEVMKKIHKFYFTCILPEIVAPKNDKNMFYILDSEIYDQKFAILM
jgi:putative phage-type endonuclease